MSTPSDRLLRLSLRGNAIFSTLCALVALAFATPLASWLGVPEPAMLTSLGVQLLLFAAFVAWLSSRETMRAWLVVAVIVADLLWVVGTVPLVAAGPLSFAGNVAAVIVADAVALFALLQFLGLRRTRSSGAAPQQLGARA